MIYRGARKDTGEMVEGYYVNVFNEPDNIHLIFPKGNLPDSFACTNGGRWDELCGLVEVHPLSLSMKTGKEDKNDKPIFGSFPLEDGTMARGGDRVWANGFSITQNPEFPVLNKLEYGRFVFTVEWDNNFSGWSFKNEEVSITYEINERDLEIIGCQWEGK